MPKRIRDQDIKDETSEFRSAPGCEGFANAFGGGGGLIWKGTLYV